MADEDPSAKQEWFISLTIAKARYTFSFQVLAGIAIVNRSRKLSVHLPSTRASLWNFKETSQPHIPQGFNHLQAISFNHRIVRKVQVGQLMEDGLWIEMPEAKKFCNQCLSGRNKMRDLESVSVTDHFHKLRGFSNQTYRLAFWLSMHEEFQNFSLEDAYANYGIQPLDACY
ncbi:hypothetical protein H0E87_007978 [Populus deltoides]|uniref:Uncharacterized protein n=1 Tax=Populus deltoides TaxID=3696 RepID=A0A8T2YYW2_POPDE|nr:hypothetical protein H0E87_007978 [Populus deltoides]